MKELKCMDLDFSRWKKKFKVCLNLGCGTNIKKGFTNIDKVKGEDVNLVLNIGHEKFPIEDDRVSYVYSKAFIEHLNKKEMRYLLKELYRICHHNALIEFICPHYLSPSSCRLSHEQRISHTFFNEYSVDNDDGTLELKRWFKISYRFTWQRLYRWFPFLIPCAIHFKLKVVK